jgi:hypothetical protein
VLAWLGPQPAASKAAASMVARFAILFMAPPALI